MEQFLFPPFDVYIVNNKPVGCSEQQVIEAIIKNDGQLDATTTFLNTYTDYFQKTPSEFVLSWQFTFVPGFSVPDECRFCCESQTDVAVVHECGHECCQTCMMTYIESRIDIDPFNITCPSCNVRISWAAIERYYPKSFKSLMKSIRKALLVRCRYTTECTCGTLLVSHQHRPSLFEKSTLLHADTSVVCPSCSLHICTSCGRDWHIGVECSDMLEFIQQLEGINALGTPCPSCHIPVIKYAGCNHITCMTRGCHSRFCSRCGQFIDINSHRDVSYHLQDSCTQIERRLSQEQQMCAVYTHSQIKFRMGWKMYNHPQNMIYYHLMLSLVVFYAFNHHEDIQQLFLDIRSSLMSNRDPVNIEYINYKFRMLNFLLKNPPKKVNNMNALLLY